MAIKSDANETDVDVETTGNKTVADERGDFLERLAQQSEEARGIESDTTADEGADVTNDGDGKSKDDTQDDLSADAQLGAADVAVLDDPTKYKVKVKLEGVEQEVTVADMVRGFQKDSVASRRLNEATQKLKEADEIKKQADELLTKAKTGDTKAKDDTVTGDDKVKGIASATIDALLNGDEQAAAESLEQLVNGRSNTTQAQEVNADEVAVKVKQQMEMESALTKFSEEYADVVADPHLSTMTNGFLKEEFASGIHTTYEEALKAAGDRTRGWLEGVTGKKTADISSTTRTDRVAKKEGAEQVPSNSASAASIDEPEETPSDVIRQMKLERGMIA